MRRHTLLGVAIALVGALAPAAAADPGPAPASSGPPSEHQRVVDYWTAERRASAIPMESRRRIPQAKPGSGGGGGAVTGARWTGGGDVVLTTGKVFFNIGASRYVCSGSLVDSPHGNLVLTAGHCVNDGDGLAFHTNWIFYPGYNNGPHPQLGAWTGTDLYTTTEWATDPNAFPDDAGFAVVTNGTATSLEQRVEAVGGNDVAVPQLSFDTTFTGTYSAFGYPAAKRYNGQTLTYCQGPVTYALDGDDSLALACNMTGGSSGGPWFQGSLSTPRIHSLNSYGYNGWNYMFGPIFDEPEQDAAAGASSGTGDCAVAATTYRCVDHAD